jgi:hypothetical protein
MFAIPPGNTYIESLNLACESEFNCTEVRLTDYSNVKIRNLGGTGTFTFFGKYPKSANLHIQNCEKVVRIRIDADINLTLGKSCKKYLSETIQHCLTQN